MKRTLLAVVVLATLPISAADAAPKKKAKPSVPKAAKFKASLTGTQVTTWTYRSAVNPDDPCDAPSAGDGSQTIRFKANPKQRLQVYKNKLMFGGRTTIIPTLEGKASVEREGEYKVDYASGDCGGDFGGGGGTEPIDCGTRTADIMLDVGYEPEPPADLDGLVPLTRPKKSVGVSGELGTWSSDFLNCPWWIGGSDDGPENGELLFSVKRFPDTKLFAKKRKNLVIAGHRTYHHKAAGFTGKTLITWTLKLKRVR